MSLAEAARAAGIATTTDQGESCTTLSPAGRPPGVGFVSTAGEDRVDVITVGAPGVRTDAGIGVGSTVAEVRQAYPGIEERLTLDGDGRLVHTPDDPVLDGFEMVFGMVDGRVAVHLVGPRRPVHHRRDLRVAARDRRPTAGRSEGLVGRNRESARPRRSRR